MSRWFVIGALSLPIVGNAFQEEPWLGDLWGCQFEAHFTYSRYRDVNGAVKQLRSPSNDKLIALELGFAPSVMCDVQFEIQFADTPRQSLGLRSTAEQVRVLWLNDVTGDPISWTTGFTGRQVTRHSLKDVSCPYSSDVNFELNTAVGKEWSQGALWTTHLWGLVGAGIANHGSLWTRALAVCEKNWNDRHRAGIYVEGYFGFGDRKEVSIQHFEGWGRYRHQSIDVGINYRYHTQVWGMFTLAYTRRVFARVFPENVNFFTVTYQVPFSFF